MESEQSYLFDENGIKLVRKGFLNEVFRKYEVNPDKAKLIKSDASLVFDCGDRFIKFTNSKFTSLEDYELQFKWLKHLHANGVKVVELIQTIDGENLINKKKEEEDQKREINIVCFKKINGAKLVKQAWSKDHFISLGELSGRLHEVSKNVSEVDFSEFKTWDKHLFFSGTDALPDDEKKLIEKLMAEFKSYDQEKSIYGLVHYDISAGNYFMDDDGEIILYDFDMLCNCWYAADIAVILFYAKFYRQTRNYENFEQIFLHYFLHGYKRTGVISSDEKEKIRKFLLYRYLAVYSNFCKYATKQQREHTHKDYLSFIKKSISVYREILGL